MKICVDLSHPAHVNFFKNAVERFVSDGNEVIITGLKRGKLPKIIEKEFPGFDIRYVGKHKGTKFSIVWDANIMKFFRLLPILIRENVDIGISFGGFLMGAILKIMRKPNIQFEDDPEAHKNAFFEKRTCTELIYPPIVEPGGKIHVMNSLKEWAHLSPKYFKPRSDVLNKYNLEPKKYIFVREISTGSFYYLDQTPNIVSQFAGKFPKEMKVLLSLEDKSNIGDYPENWILLQEPVDSIHSLMYYSRIIISSGDSMAREGAMLGVPSIYCGFRDMAANRFMAEKGMMFCKKPDQVPSFIQWIIDGTVKIQEQDHFRDGLLNDWIDTTQFIVDRVYKYKMEK